MPEDPEAAAGELEDESLEDESQPGSQPDTTDGEESEGEPTGPQTVPLRRFKEVNSRFRQAANVANWYRENIGDPKDVVAFRNWKEQQARAETQPTEPEAPTTVTPAQLKAVRKLMRDSDPEYRELLAEREQTKQERAASEEVMYDDAYTEIGKLAKDNGIKLSDQGRLRLSRQVMLEIRNDPKLIRQWDRRDMECVRSAFDAVNEHLLKPIGGRSNGAAVDAATRRRASRLPTAPAGGSPTSSVNIPKQKEKGINQETHARAFELLQQSQRE
jgi:hypothetical protein